MIDRNAPCSPEDWRNIGKSRREIAELSRTDAERALADFREEDDALEPEQETQTSA